MKQRFVLFFMVVTALTALVSAKFLFFYTPSTGGQRSDFDAAMSSGKNYYDQGDAAKAAAAFERAVAAKGNDIDARLDLANALLLGDKPEQALDQALHAVKLDHNSPGAHYVAGCALLRLGRAKEAIQSLQNANNLDRSVAAVSFELGQAYFAAGEFEEAVTALTSTIELEPNHPAAHYVLSQALVRLEKPADAEAELARHAEVLAKLGNVRVTPLSLERCKYTQARLAFKLEQPPRDGIKVKFFDATATAFHGHAADFSGPIATIDFNHTGTNSLVVREKNSFRLLSNSNGVFEAVGEAVEIPGDRVYTRLLVGDLQHDRYDDVVAIGPQGSQVLRFLTNGLFADLTMVSGLGNVSATDGLLIDLNFSGKLDLITCGGSNHVVELFQNLGNLRFLRNSEALGLPADFGNVKQISAGDWNRDSMLDLAFAREGQPVSIETKVRGAGYAPVQEKFPAGKWAIMGDLNNDLRTDLLVVENDGFEIIYSEINKHEKIAVDTSRFKEVKLIDYDNDGWLDIVAIGQGIRVWRNRGEAGFLDVTESLGLNAFAGRSFDGLASADFDNDCDTDLILSETGKGLVCLRNDGGSQNHQLKIYLRGNRSNASGLGTILELSSGDLRVSRTVASLPIEIGVGRHDLVEAIGVHWFDLGDGVVDAKADCQVLTIDELIIPGGSCPYLYCWDGKKFRFVTDILGAAPVGLPVTARHIIDSDPFEYVHLGGEETMQPLDGSFRLNITEELREALYLDEARLVVADHPQGTMVVSTSKLRPGKPFPKPELLVVRPVSSPSSAMRSDGLDVTDALREIDGNMASPVQLRVPQLRGLAEEFSITFGFPEIDAGKPLALVLTGWLRFGGGMANMAASQNPDLPFPFPKLEMQMADGTWKPLDIDVGAPAGKTKAMLIDLEGHLPAGVKNFRLTTSFEIHWDQILLAEKMGKAKEWSMMPSKADLNFRGFSRYLDLPWDQPLTPNYTNVYLTPKWGITPSGWCTRYGAVGDLLQQADGAFVVMNGGDQISLSFAAAEIPAKKSGEVRDYFLHAAGWDKDSDFHVVTGTSIYPLPFYGMDDQLYPHQKAPALPTRVEAMIDRYNTRWVDPQTFRR